MRLRHEISGAVFLDDAGMSGIVYNIINSLQWCSHNAEKDCFMKKKSLIIRMIAGFLAAVLAIGGPVLPASAAYAAETAQEAAETETADLPAGTEGDAGEAFSETEAVEDVILMAGREIPMSGDSAGVRAELLQNADGTDTLHLYGSGVLGAAVYYTLQSYMGNVTEVVIDEGITEMKLDFFADQTKLRKVSLPASLTRMDADAFSGCPLLKSAGPSGSGCNIEFAWKEALPANAFAGCTYLTAVMLPQTLKSIGDSAFDRCSSLPEIGLPSGLTSLGYHAFCGCSSLTGLSVPAGVSSVGMGFIRDCPQLKSAGPAGSGCDVIFGWTASLPDEAFIDCNSLTKIVLPSGLTRIGSSMFRDCSSLKTISVPETVTEIGRMAFGGCSSLTSFKIPGKVTAMPGDVFSGCSSLTGLSIPAGLTTFTGGGWLSGCTGLKSAGPAGSGCNIEFAWENGIPARAFAGCDCLTKVTLPDSFTDIGIAAFSKCTGLTKVTLPRGLAVIKTDVFSGCKSLKTLTLPASVSQISSGAFSGCSGLSGLRIGAEHLNIDKKAFAGCDRLVFHCSPNSDAALFAKANQIPCVLTPVPVNGKTGWIRLAGTGRYDTMAAIVGAGFSGTGGTAVVATGANFKDALAAAGFAGLYQAPIILTDGKKLSGQAASQLKRLKPREVYIAGGSFAVSSNVESEIRKETGAVVLRLSGSTSAGTSADMLTKGYRNRYFNAGWSDTAFIVTNKTFKDALSAAPLSYCLHMPILLADNGRSLSADVLRALTGCGIHKVIIVGGELAVTKDVEKQLGQIGISSQNLTRIAGRTAVETSAAIAEYGISQGMAANKMGVATSQNYPDALAGAALCGRNHAVLLLADDKAMGNTSFPKRYKDVFANGYIFGGTAAVGNKTLKALEAVVK